MTMMVMVRTERIRNNKINTNTKQDTETETNKNKHKKLEQTREAKYKIPPEQAPLEMTEKKHEGPKTSITPKHGNKIHE